MFIEPNQIYSNNPVSVPTQINSASCVPGLRTLHAGIFIAVYLRDTFLWETMRCHIPQERIIRYESGSKSTPGLRKTNQPLSRPLATRDRAERGNTDEHPTTSRIRTHNPSFWLVQNKIRHVLVRWTTSKHSSIPRDPNQIYYFRSTNSFVCSSETTEESRWRGAESLRIGSSESPLFSKMPSYYWLNELFGSCWFIHKGSINLRNFKVLTYY
jgi:hypothetical protein